MATVGEPKKKGAAKPKRKIGGNIPVVNGKPKRRLNGANIPVVNGKKKRKKHKRGGMFGAPGEVTDLLMEVGGIAIGLFGASKATEMMNANMQNPLSGYIVAGGKGLAGYAITKLSSNKLAHGIGVGVMLSGMEEALRETGFLSGEEDGQLFVRLNSESYSKKPRREHVEDVEHEVIESRLMEGEEEMGEGSYITAAPSFISGEQSHFNECAEQDGVGYDQFAKEEDFVFQA